MGKRTRALWQRNGYAATNHAFFTTSRTGRISWPGFEQMALSSRYRTFLATVTVLQHWLAVSALTIHGVILNGALRVVFRKWRLGSLTIGLNKPNTYATYYMGHSYRYSIVSVASVLITSTFMFGLITIFSFILRKLETRNYALLAFPFFNTFLVLVSTAINSDMFNVTSFATYSALYIFGFTSLGFVMSLAVVSFLSSRFIMLGKNLLVVLPSRSETSPKLDYGGFLSLMLFLTTVLGSALWYGYIYDSDGTVNPSWTGIFG
jgi:hypothetical protein